MLGTKISFEFKDKAKCPTSRKIFSPEIVRKTQSEAEDFTSKGNTSDQC